MTMPGTCRTLFLMTLVAAASAACGERDLRDPAATRRVAPIIPAVNQADFGEGAFLLGADTPVTAAADDADSRWTAGWLRDMLGVLEARAGTSPEGSRSQGAITLTLGPPGVAANPEGYRLSVEPDGIEVSAGAPAGLFYGAVSLWQLATAGDRTDRGIRIPAVRIDDAPRFGWRGLMLDSARHFVAPEDVRRMIDWMALHKLNVLHWHLTDDQGWRLEIRRYPRLTEIGAWRIPAGTASAPGARYGGYYTQDEVRGIVEYAAHRQIAIVPEIEMPGHAQAAIAAYPELGTEDAQPPVSADWGVHDYLFNVDESTFETLENILAEVMEMFPGRYVHVGGDEAVKDRWAASARVQARMRELGIDDETALQSYFTRRIEAYLNEHGRRLIGWDEILEGGIAPQATVMSWRGVDGAVAAASQGHDAVLSPAPTLYFDHRQSNLPSEPPGRGEVVSLADVYAFDPVPAALGADEREHVLGLQANLWSEHIRTGQRLAWMAFPRAAAVAEVGWSAAERRSWPDFLERLAVQFERYRLIDMPFATSAFDVQVTASFHSGSGEVSVELDNQAGFGTIRYTTDGSPATAAAAAYDRGLHLPASADLSTAVFEDGIELTRARHGAVGLLARRRYSQQLELCTQRLVLSLEDNAPRSGERAVFLVDIMNPCWIWPDVDLSGLAGLDVAVGQVPFNFQIGDAREGIEVRPSADPDGELVVRGGGCDGGVLARSSLRAARGNDALTELSVDLDELPAETADLCFRFDTPGIDPTWAIDRVELRYGPDAGR